MAIGPDGATIGSVQLDLFDVVEQRVQARSADDGQARQRARQASPGRYPRSSRRARCNASSAGDDDHPMIDVILPALDEAMALPALLARASARITARSSWTTARPTTRPRSPRPTAPSSWTSHVVASGLPAPPGWRRRRRTSCASWTPTGRSIRGSCTWSTAPVLDGTADLVLGARQPTRTSVARPRPGRQPGARARAAPANGRGAHRPRPDARRPSQRPARPRHHRPALRLATGDGAARRRCRVDDRRGPGALRARESVGPR